MRVFRDLSNLPAFKNAIITIGTFDGVHKGHQKLLNRIKNLAHQRNGESILLTFHPHPRFVINPDDKSLKLLNTLDEKIKLLEKYGIDNLVVAPFSRDFSQMLPIEYIKDFLVNNFSPDTIVIGYDHHFGRNRGGNIHLLNEYAPIFRYNIEEISKEMLDDIGISSTKIRQALQKGNVALAAELLGHSYSIEGYVIKGEQIGRTLGYPTANIRIEVPYKLIPKNGVYAVKVSYQKQSLKGMLNIGNRPTFEGTNKSIEVHIFDFDGDIYGEKIQLDFIEFLRDEQKFDSKEELVSQLSKDKIAAINY